MVMVMVMLTKESQQAGHRCRFWDTDDENLILYERYPKIGQKWDDDEEKLMMEMKRWWWWCWLLLWVIVFVCFVCLLHILQVFQMLGFSYLTLYWNQQWPRGDKCLFETGGAATFFGVSQWGFCQRKRSKSKHKQTQRVWHKCVFQGLSVPSVCPQSLTEKRILKWKKLNSCFQWWW